MNEIVKRIKRDINGVVLLDKPKGLSSNDALQKVKRLYNAKKAGHTGSLDPLASGLLPICLGEATKFSQYLLTADKVYRVKIKLGVRTTTSDAEGEVVAEKPVPHYTIEQIDQAFSGFRGEIEQIPSMFSALKHKGQPLYKLARQGIEVERPKRRIHIYDLTVLSYQHEIVEISVHCSKGTYVRTIADDFGEHLGCGAHVIELRRVAVGNFTQEENMHTLEALTLKASDDFNDIDRLLLPMESTVFHLPVLEVNDTMALFFRRGQAIFIPQTPEAGVVALRVRAGKFIGIGEVQEDGRVAPKRLMRTLRYE